MLLWKGWTAVVAAVGVVLGEVHGPGHEREYEKDGEYGRDEREEALQGVDVIDVLLVIGRF